MAVLELTFRGVSLGKIDPATGAKLLFILKLCII